MIVGTQKEEEWQERWVNLLRVQCCNYKGRDDYRIQEEFWEFRKLDGLERFLGGSIDEIL